MRESYRVKRLQEVFKEEISRLLVEGRIKDPRIGFVTITKVDITKDLSQAVVYYTVLGDEKSKEETKIALDSAAGFIQGKLGKSLRVKKIPKIRFKEDKNLEYSLRIFKLLEEIKKG